jgi:chromosome partitioning protein
MRSIALINQKGGVGKTTTAVNVAAGLVEAGARVLLVDLDPQSHATMHVGIEPESAEPGIYEVLVNGTAVSQAIRDTGCGLSVVPARVDLVGAEVELAEQADRELLLRTALEPIHGRFDVMIVDCAPSLGTLTINALAAVDEVIIPLQPHFLALQGLGRLLETVSLVRGVLNASLHISGIAMCMFEKGTRLAQEVESDVRQFVESAAPHDAWYGARIFSTVVRRNIKLAECPSFGQTIFEYAPSSHGAEDYRALAREVLEMTAPPVADEAEVQKDATPIVQEATASAADVLPPGTAAVDTPPAKARGSKSRAVATSDVAET